MWGEGRLEVSGLGTVERDQDYGSAKSVCAVSERGVGQQRCCSARMRWRGSDGPRSDGVNNADQGTYEQQLDHKSTYYR